MFEFLISNKINPAVASPAQLKWEFKYSLLSFPVYLLSTVFTVWACKLGYMAIYRDPLQFGTFYLVFSFFVLVAFHETYFYFIHRFMHLPLIFSSIHRVHHLSRNPTLWTSYSFHPIEALLQVGFVPIVVFMVPLYPPVLYFYLFLNFLSTIHGHFGYEHYRKGFTERRFLGWINTPTAHNLHHSDYGSHFGLSTLFWDRVCGTCEKGYAIKFNRVAR